jgi:DNA-directed RNA polymerase specialized sigma24 family protein
VRLAREAEDLVQETVARVLVRPRFLRSGAATACLVHTLRKDYLTLLRSASGPGNGMTPRAGRNGPLVRLPTLVVDARVAHAEGTCLNEKR